MPFLIRSACLTGYVELARSLAIDPLKLLREARLDQSCLLDPDVKISVDAANQLLEQSANAAGIEDFGLRLSETRRPSNLGPIALATRDATTLREALEAAARYIPLHCEAMMLSFEPMGGATIFKIDFAADRTTPGRQAIELTVAVAHRFMRQMLDRDWRSLPVWLAHGAPADMTTHLRIFGPWVEFGRQCHGILLEQSDLETPLAGGDAAMARHVQQYLEPLLAQANITVSEKTRRLVYDLLVLRRASVDHVASCLGVNRRTLSRQLARDGETFSSIVDQVRSDLARRYVGDDKLPLSDVAHLLGFSEASAFSRWFRAEFNCTPLSWRALTTDQVTAS